MKPGIEGRIPSLRGGGGLPGRQIALCDGRTTLRISQILNGFDLLCHYAADSWFKLSNVLKDPEGGKALRWKVDGRPHEFEWVEVFPFGYVNRDEHAGKAVVSSCAVEEGAAVWEFVGVARYAELSIPKAMFLAYSSRDSAGRSLEVAGWELDPVRTGRPCPAWTARRKEEWLLRDSSTYAGIAGVKIEEEPHSSELFLSVSGSGMSVSDDAENYVFRIKPRDGKAFLSIVLASSAESAESGLKAACSNPRKTFMRQLRRYAEIAEDVPEFGLGRHTALKRFFKLTPLYLEAMRIKGEPGAYRANNDYYWVWGWDMTRPAFGILCSNRADFVRELLELRHKYGCINQYDNTLRKDLRHDFRKPGALELMLAHDYLAWSGDIGSVRRWCPEYKDSVEHFWKESGPTGMLPGAAASTDFPEEFGRTFPAWMSYTASWHYAGLLCAEKLLIACGENSAAAKARELASRVRNNFKRVFWNPRTGFWNEGVHPENPDLVCDIPLSTAVAAMDSPYGEDLYGDKTAASAEYCAREFLREDGVHITARNEVRGWKEWTRQPNNWFAANDTMLVRLFRSVADAESLEKLFYLYEINFGYQPAAFEGKPFRRPLNTSGSWQAFGAGAWFRNLVEGAAGFWVDLGGASIMPCGLGEPVSLKGIRVRNSVFDVLAHGQGAWPRKFLLDGKAVIGTTKLPPMQDGYHRIEVEYGPEQPSHPILTLAVDAEVGGVGVKDGNLSFTLAGKGYTPVSFFSPSKPAVSADGKTLPCEWDELTGRGRTRLILAGKTKMMITA